MARRRQLGAYVAYDIVIVAYGRIRDMSVACGMQVWYVYHERYRGRLWHSAWTGERGPPTTQCLDIKGPPTSDIGSYSPEE